METIAKQRISVKQQMSDILLDISWAKLSQKYFGKSRSWLYHKLDGALINGKPAQFTTEEKRQLRDALKDLSVRINTCANEIH